MTPADVDASGIWEIAAALGRNRGEQIEPWPEDAPAEWAIRRHLALSEGREPPGADEPITREERKRMLALVQGGKRKTG